MQSSISSGEAVVRLSRPQVMVAACKARFRVLVAGRRTGKSFLCRFILYQKARQNPATVCWYVAPTYRMARQIMWKELKEHVPTHEIQKKDETDLRIELVNGSIIALRGADNPDSLRGVGLDLAVLDEVQDIDPDTWLAVLRPALADRMGRALFCGTPKGFNWFYDIFSGAEAQPDWEAFRFRTIEGGRVAPDEIEAARRSMDERLFRQEFEAAFETQSGRVYHAFERNLNCVPLDDTGGTLHIGMDFNVNPMSAIICVEAGNELHAIDEISLPDANTSMMAQALRDRYGNRHAAVYPDPSGKARKTSAAVGQTDFSILEGFGFDVVASRKAPPVVDRINEVNALTADSDGVRRFYVDPKCTHLIKSLEGLVYKIGTSVPDKTSGLDHMADALGYLIHEMYPIDGGGASGPIKISNYFG
jgi:hypothetical protein